MFQSRHITKFFVHQISTTHWSTSKNLWMPWTFHGPIQLPFFVRPLHARCILERQTPVRWWWWRRFRIRKLWVIYIYIYIFWKNLEKKAYSNCPSFFFTLEDLQTERNRMLLAKHDKTILYFATNQTSTKAYVDKKYLPNGTFEHRWLNFAHVQVWISNNHKSLQKPKIPWKTYQRAKNIWLKKLKLPSTLGANWNPKPKPNQLPPNVDLFQLLQMFFIRGAWEGQFRQAFHLRNCVAFKSHPFFNYPNPEPSLMSQKLFPKKKQS